MAGSCFGEFLLWIPLILVTLLCVGLPIVLDADWIIAVAVYGGLMVLFSLMFFYMGKTFNYGWFRASVQSKRRLDDQWAIVTGANSGSGYEVAKELVRRGCNVVITCRSQKKADATIESITRELRNETAKRGKLDAVLMDLCSKRSIDGAVNTILNEKKVPVSILVNNAGAVLNTYIITEDGIEGMWQANYLAPFYLTRKLLPTIKSTSESLGFGRIVNVASIGHQLATPENFEAFMSDDKRGDLSFWTPQASSKVYGDTKCAQILFGTKLQEILDGQTDSQGTSIGSYLWVTSLHPGYINSGFYRPSEYPFLVRMIWYYFYPFQSLFALITPKQGAQTSLHCALSDENVKPGHYHGNCAPQETSPKADPVLQTKKEILWHKSEQIWPTEEANGGADNV